MCVLHWMWYSYNMVINLLTSRLAVLGIGPLDGSVDSSMLIVYHLGLFHLL